MRKATPKKSRTAPNRNRSNRSARTSRTSSRKTTSRRKQPLNQQWLKDFISQMLAVERGGEKLYQKTLDQLEHEELQDRIERYLEQTRRHVELCEQMLEKVAEDSDYMSTSAHAAEKKAEGLLSAEVEDQMRDLNNLENLVLAEHKDEWNWQTLSSVVGEIQDREVKQVVKKAVSEVLKQERDHVKWVTDQVTKLAAEMAHREEGEMQERPGSSNGMHGEMAEE